jgi:hypothetical protein
VFVGKHCSERPARTPKSKCKHDIRNMSRRNRVRAGEMGVLGTEQQSAVGCGIV